MDTCTPQKDSRILTRRAALATFSASLAVGLGSRAALADGEVRIDHVYGRTVLTAPPKRVVSIGFNTQDTILALGTRPIAVRRWFGEQPGEIWPWAKPYLQGPLPEVLAGELSVEAIAALEPDLVVGIGSGLSREQYDVLSRIAPVLMQGKDDPTYGTPWDEVARRVGRALGKDALADSLIARTRESFGAARARHPAWAGKTAVAAYARGGEPGAFTAIDTRSRFLAELGFKPTPGLERVSIGGNFYVKLTPEDLSPLDADLLVWISAVEDVPSITGLAMRRFLRAHTEGREVLPSPLVASALSFGSVISLPYALAALEDELAAALDGDPATPVPSAVAAGLTG
ncbi:ABC transporter substrate-binding protein [Acetobacteraceae bacterium H6797]|nr:ABC transporter substrate-binding protein [Acetobacteraceae bacterium H6797]